MIKDLDRRNNPLDRKKKKKKIVVPSKYGIDVDKHQFTVITAVILINPKCVEIFPNSHSFVGVF